MESDEEWHARLRREQQEQELRERQRQRMASIQARATALDSPLKVNIAEIETAAEDRKTTNRQSNTSTTTNNASDLYAAALKSGVMSQTVDQNGRTAKEEFFNSDLAKLVYLPYAG